MVLAAGDGARFIGELRSRRRSVSCHQLQPNLFLFETIFADGGLVLYCSVLRGLHQLIGHMNTEARQSRADHSGGPVMVRMNLVASFHVQQKCRHPHVSNESFIVVSRLDLRPN